MDYIRDRLLREIVKFLELCQDYFIKRKIEINEYYSLTNVKFSFIESVLETESNYIFVNSEMESRLEKLYYTDSCIYNMQKSVAGE